MAGKKPEGGGMGRGSNGKRGGGGKKAITNIKTKKALTPAQVKARELKVRVDRVKKSEAAQDLKNKNLDNFNKRFDRKPRAPITKKNNSPFGPVAAGIVKPTPKGKGPRGR